MAKTTVHLTPRDLGAAIKELMDEKKAHQAEADKLNAEIAKLQADYERQLADLAAAHVKALQKLSAQHRVILDKSIAVDDSLTKLVNTNFIDEHA